MANSAVAGVTVSDCHMKCLRLWHAVASLLPGDLSSVLLTGTSCCDLVKHFCGAQLLQKLVNDIQFVNFVESAVLFSMTKTGTLSTILILFNLFFAWQPRFGTSVWQNHSDLVLFVLSNNLKYFISVHQIIISVVLSSTTSNHQSLCVACIHFCQHATKF